MIVARIIVCVVLSIVLVGAMYGAFEGIRIKDDRLALMCSIASALIGLLAGFCIANII